MRRKMIHDTAETGDTMADGSRNNYKYYGNDDDITRTTLLLVVGSWYINIMVV